VSEIAAQIILIVTAYYVGEVGYGEVFNCDVKMVVAGTMPHSRLTLTILAGDDEKLQFIKTHLQPAQFEMTFSVNRKDEPYSMMPISGFVDDSGTSWKIEAFREVQENFH
jgi:hypothetical protein